ncbi:MAG: MFS transporter, partial [Gordonibacter sp.]
GELFMQLAHPQKRLGPRSFFACALAINLLLILSIDMYVPALPSMQRVFDVTEAYLNLTVFAFFVFSAVGVIMAGPVSDRFGRKPVQVLIVFRIGQALGYGAVVTIETALIKDSFDGNDLKLAMTALQSLIIIGPAVAPFLGTFILTFSDWRGIFTLLTVCGFVALGLSLLISETHPHASKAERSQTGVGAALGSMVSDIRILMHDRKFSSLALFMGIAGMPYFAFIAVVSYILMDFFAVSYFEYSMIYAGACLVTIAAPYVYVALSKRLSVRAILVLCVWLTAASFVMLALFGTASPVLFLVAFVPYALAEGIVRPMAFVVLLDQPSSRVGAASSFSNFSYALLTSFATVIATLQWPNFIFGIAVLTGASVLVMAGLYVWGLRKKAD